MKSIANKHDLRVAYEMLHMYSELCNEHPTTDPVQLENRDDFLRELKQDIRKYTNKPASEARIFGDDNYGSCIQLAPLPDHITTRAQADEWFMDNEYIPVRYTYYSPTGWPFTHWYKLVFRHNRWWAYHCVGIDC